MKIKSTLDLKPLIKDLKLNNRTQKKHILAKRDSSCKVYKGPIFNKPKDLVNITRILESKLNKEGYVVALEHFKSLLKNKYYIPFYKHIKGKSHHRNLGPSARPFKTYQYVIEFLKARKLLFSELKPNTYYRVLILRTGRVPHKPAKLPRMSNGGNYKTYAKLAIRLETL